MIRHFKNDMSLLRNFLVLGFVIFFTTATLAAPEQCATYFKENFKTNNEPVADKARYFRDIRWLIQQTKPEIRRRLSQINNKLGTDIELAQTLSFLSGVQSREMMQLQNVKTIDNAVIYGSTNVPLYTLVAQVFLVGSFSRNVWVRTPEATRQVYIDLFEMLKPYLPRTYTDNIHLVTDPSDLSYDMFNRIFVMGQNRQGEKQVRKPAELVVLTGNPDTARTMIERNLRNFKRIYGENGVQSRQLFLGFLAGVNPAVVVSSAKSNLPEVIDNLVFPFLVNGGQDCMNSDIVFAHADITKDLTRGLIEKFKTIPLTKNDDVEAGITPITMSKGFDKLIAYKKKYAAYLITPDAILDEATRTVSPHIFVIPFSKFKELDIQEHFAPFMTIVKYDSDTQLNEASLDPRLQKRAMYALLYGAKRMTPDLERARDIFRQTQHLIVSNSHLYQEFEMNMPFGGIGTDSSMSVLATQIPGGFTVVENRNRPLIISKEVESAFPQSVELPPENRSVQPWQTTLSTPAKAIPFKDLVSKAKEGGLSVALMNDYSSGYLPKAEKLYGVKLINPSNKRKVKGVVLHITDTTRIIENPLVMGDLNPLIASKPLLLKMGSKSEELRLVRAVDPTLMPRINILKEELTPNEWSSFFDQKDKLLQTLVDASQGGLKADARLHSLLYVFLKDFLDLIHSHYPKGAFVKNYGEYASGDAGSAITTFSASPLQIVREFLLNFEQARSRYPKRSFLDPDFQKVITSGMFGNYSRFMTRLLTNPDEMTVQERLDVGQTLLGSPMEFRVDFIQGQPVASRMRFGFEYYPEEMEQAKKVIADFMRKAPDEFKHLSGGADVYRMRDGRWGVFEFNFGGASGTLWPGYYPFEANRIFSKIQAQDTGLIRFLKGLHEKPIQEQRAFILKQKNEKPIWWRLQIEDISQLEWAKELRDLRLDQWRRSKNKVATAEKLRADLRELLEGLGTNGNLDFQRLLETAEYYINSELKRSENP